jgi:hypothetical protein
MRNFVLKLKSKTFFMESMSIFVCRSSPLGSSFGEETTIEGNHLNLLLTTHVYGQQLFGSLIILNLQVLASRLETYSWNLLKPEVTSKIKCGEF